jgi:hypothetical protein
MKRTTTTKGIRWPVKCVECGKGNVVPTAAPGRTTRYKTLPDLAVPEDLEIPTCDACGTEWIDRQAAKAVDAALEPVYQQRLGQHASACLKQLSEHVTQQRLEKILGLSQGYLSKIRSGASKPSPMLVSILALLAVDPERRLREVEETALAA